MLEPSIKGGGEFTGGGVPLQTTYPPEYIDRLKAATPGNGLLHRSVAWNIVADIDRLFREELCDRPVDDPQRLIRVRELYDEQRQLAQAAQVSFAQEAAA